MRIRKISETEVKGLGEQVREARLASDKSLTTLCSEVGFSTTYWYDVEKEEIKGALSDKNLRAIERVLKTSFGVELNV